MRFYLSSYKLGNQIEKLRTLIPANKKAAYIANALDYYDGQDWLVEHIQSDINNLTALGLEVEQLDLRKYFGNKAQLALDLLQYGVIWASGGNVFVLRQAMSMSGFDELLINHLLSDNVLYGGYSAGVCVLAPSLRGLELVDNPDNTPYKSQPVIWDGLSILDYLIIPHYKSDHPESAAVDKVIEYCKKNKIKYHPLKDGEVIIKE